MEGMRKEVRIKRSCLRPFTNNAHGAIIIKEYTRVVSIVCYSPPALSSYLPARQGALYKDCYMHIILPFPPSVNQLFGGGSRQKRFPSKKYKEWLAECPKLEPLDLDCQFEIEYVFYWPDNRVRDGQNYMKAPLDYITSSRKEKRILKDDSWKYVIGEKWTHRGIDKDNPRVEMFLKKIT